MRKNILTIICLLWVTKAHLQVSISTNSSPADTSAMLDIKSTSKGILIPRMDLSQRNGIVRPENSLMIYQTDSSPGFYYNAGTKSSPNWTPIAGTQSNYKIPITTLPFTISQPGSYILTANLSGSRGIKVTASNVSIDLNFFTLSGDINDTTSGIYTIAGVSNLSVYNGTIRDWNGNGINSSLSDHLYVFNVKALSNGQDGIEGGDESIISHCISSNNGGDGIALKNNGEIAHCVVDANSNIGISIMNDCVITNCIATFNTSYGFRGNNGCYFSDCQGNSNQTGFYLTNRSKLYNCQSLNNSNSGFYLGDRNSISQCYSSGNINGIFAEKGNHISNNTIIACSANGIKLTGDMNHIEGNFMTENGIGLAIVGGKDNIIIKNSSIKNTTSAYSVGPNNAFAPVYNLFDVTGAAISNPLGNIGY